MGNPKIQGYEIELWKIISEYMSDFNFKLLKVYKDPIERSNMFLNRQNLNPEGMKFEYLTVLKKI